MKNDIKKVISRLNEYGYQEVIENQVSKNGVLHNGIIIREDKIVNPVIYVDHLFDEFGNDIDAIVREIIRTYESNKEFDVDLDEILSKEYIYGNVYIALQKASSEDIIKDDCMFPEVEQYLYVRGNNEDCNYTIKVTNSLLERVEITNNEIWEAARQNTFKKGNTTIVSVSKLITEMMGIEDIKFDIPLYCITNKDSIKGSSAALDIGAIREWASNFDNINQLVCIPSSIDECLLFIPSENTVNLDEINQIIWSVNHDDVVDKEHQLSDKAIIINL